MHVAGATNVLTNVPAFDWSYGCSATSASMLFGYYDRTGYSNMYTGPTNGGIAPLDNSVWGHTTYPSVTCGEDPLSATHNGVDGRTIKGSVDDYWIDLNNSGPDPYLGNWTEHTPDAAGDFMGTNQAKFSNPDGSTRFYFSANGDPLIDYTGYEPTYRDGCHGLKLFAESRGYTVTTNFNQLIQGQGTDPTKGFTFANFQAEINAGRPVLIQVTNHTMLGYGYNTTGNIIYVHDTWDYSNHTMTWGGTYPYGSTPLQHYGVTVIRLAPSVAAPTVTNSTGASNIQDISARLNGELTTNGGATTTVHIYWGTTDGGTTAVNWAHDINLGTKSIGTFSADISGLTANTKYYYRCYATNSGGTGWADATASFTTTVTQLKLIGVDAGITTSGSNPANYFFLERFLASTSGNVVNFKFKASASGNVKVAIYSDNSGEPSTLINAVNTSTAVVAGWNDIAFPSTSVTSGTYYWLAFNSDAAIGYYQSATGTIRYKSAMTYSSFNFPTPAGAGFTTLTTRICLLAGWGFLPTPVAPTIVNAAVTNTTATSARLNGNLTNNGNENPNVHIYWGLTDGGTTPGSWDYDLNLGTKSVGTFFSDISSLTASTQYYYRCYASNSGGSAWADSSATFTTAAPPPPPVAPTVTNSTGASNVLDTSARLNGELTNNGNENPTVHIYWGLTDGGTTAVNWAHDINLGILPVGTFYSDITTSAGMKYYYRCYATNSAGGSWADATASFTTAATPIKLIGVDAGITTSGSNPANYFFLERFQAVATGNLITFKFKASGSGHIKVAIYADSSGEPSTLINAVNTSTAVVAGWNDITFPATSVTSGTYYWLAFNSDAAIGYYQSATGTIRYKSAMTYSSFTFPSTAGTGFTTLTTRICLLAGWGFEVLPTPPPTPVVTSPGTAITFKWNASTGATKYYLQVNTNSSFTGTSLFDAEVGNVTSQEVTGFTTGITYYWRIKAGNAGGWSDWTVVRSFITN